ncbi:MAG: hypothetical protein H0U74_17800 [Bradymonadaceae bacterium]|nr:hypothetical protein [Lujinxingiaceae bacterium]
MSAIELTLDGPYMGVAEKGQREVLAQAPYTEAEREAAIVQALEANWADGLVAVRGIWPTASFIAMALAVCILVMIPQLQGLWRVDVALVLPLMGAVCTAVVMATWVYRRHGPSHPMHFRATYTEGITVMLVGIALIYASGSAGSVWWLVIVAQLFNISQRPRIKSFSMCLELGGIALLVALFMVSGQWWDGLASILFGGICIWLLWIMLGGQMSNVRGTAERSLLERKLQSVHMERERERIARDLHDGIGAELTSLIFQARALKSDALSEHQKARLESFVEQARGNLDELRGVVWSLQHETMEWADIIGRLARKCTSQCPAAVSFVLVDRESPVGPLPGEWPHHIVHIAQEAVRNAVRHGEPGQITLTIGVDEDALRLEVVDDGKGITAEAVAASRGGLRNMKRRASNLGGTLEIEDAAPGVRVRAVFSRQLLTGVPSKAVD